MSKKEEIYQDITENCNVILDLLKDFKAENETPEGRMIYQCQWLKEQVAVKSLSLPVEDFVQTLKYVSAEQLLLHLASSDDRYNKEIGVFLYRLTKLVKYSLLLKPAYYPYAIKIIKELLSVLNGGQRKLSEYELGLIGELEILKQSLFDYLIDPPLMRYLPGYFNFSEVYVIFESTIDDLPNGKYLCKTVANLIFEGIRPDTWLTPEDADKETKILTGS